MAISCLIRIGFASTFAYTFLNSVGILKTPLTFPWIVILIPAVFGWWFWEKVSRKKLAYRNLTGGIIMFLISGELIGNNFGFFENVFWYDKVVHFIGGLTIGLIIYLILEYLQNKHNWHLSLKFLIIFSLAITMMGLVLWEFYEYFIDYINVGNMISDKFDTVDDLLFGFIGASISTVCAVYFLKEPEKIPLKQEFAQKP